MQPLDFTQHARDELNADGLTEEDVYTVVADFDEMIERADDRTEYARLLDDGRHVTVVVEADNRTIVTVWWNKRRSRRPRQ